MLPSEVRILYSYLRATNGSIFVARRAGKQHARMATTAPQIATASCPGQLLIKKLRAHGLVHTRPTDQAIHRSKQVSCIDAEPTTLRLVVKRPMPYGRPS